MKLDNSIQIYKGNSQWKGKVYWADTLIWPVSGVDYCSQYLTLEAAESGVTSSLWFIDSAGAEITDMDIEFSKNNGAWTHYVSATTAEKSVSYGDKIRVRGLNNNYSIGCHLLIAPNGYKIYGNIMSLVYGDSFEGKLSLPSGCGFSLLFSAHLFGPDPMPFDAVKCLDISNVCLPATALTEECYTFMFSGHQYITKAPLLPASYVPSKAYRDMFYSCSNLNMVECLATSWESNSFSSWLNGVSQTGTFVKHPNAVWATGGDGIPSGWTVVNG